MFWVLDQSNSACINLRETQEWFFFKWVQYIKSNDSVCPQKTCCLADPHLGLVSDKQGFRKPKRSEKAKTTNSRQAREGHQSTLTTINQPQQTTTTLSILGATFSQSQTTFPCSSSTLLRNHQASHVARAQDPAAFASQCRTPVSKPLTFPGSWS